MPGDFGDQTTGDGSRHDVYGTVDPYAPSVANGGITPEQWAEYQKKRRRAAILGILGTVGGASAAGLLPRRGVGRPVGLVPVNSR
jgi:hypothetical protein